jgi:hypothetical protein
MTASGLQEVGIKSFERFLSHLGMIRDPRRAEGMLYKLPHVLLFAILAIVTGANSYRGNPTFIKTHRRRLNKAFKIGWKPAAAPARATIRARSSFPLMG